MRVRYGLELYTETKSVLGCVAHTVESENKLFPRPHTSVLNIPVQMCEMCQSTLGVCAFFMEPSTTLSLSITLFFGHLIRDGRASTSPRI